MFRLVGLICFVSLRWCVVVCYDVFHNVVCVFVCFVLVCVIVVVVVLCCCVLFVHVGDVGSWCVAMLW